MLVWLAVRWSSGLHLSWGTLFLCFLIDDAGQIHEMLGFTVARLFFPAPIFGFREQDIGELFVVGVAGLLLVLLIGIAHFRSRPELRTMSRPLVALVAALLFFGVVIDVTDMMLVDAPKILYYGYRMLEDAGEMVVMSVICWYVFRRYLEETTQR